MFCKQKAGAGLMIGNIASEIGKGLMAGAAGTLAITLSQMIEMKITKRKPSDDFLHLLSLHLVHMQKPLLYFYLQNVQSLKHIP